MTDEGWTTMRFDEFAERVNETVMPAESDLNRYIGLAHLDSMDLSIRRWDEGRNLVGQKYIVRKGDIIIARRNWYLRRVAIAPFDALCSAHAMIVRPKAGAINSDYFPFFLLSDQFFEKALAISVGSLSPTINWKTLREICFNLPSLTVQNNVSIAMNEHRLLKSNIDSSISNLKGVNDALFHTLLNSNTNGQSIESKWFGTVPAEWEITSLGELCERITDGEHNTPPRTDSGILLLSARNVHNGILDFSKVDYISDETYQTISKRIIPQKGDILISCSGTIGRVCAVPDDLKFQLVRSVALIRPRNNVLPIFLELQLRSKYLQRQMFVETSQQAQGNLFQNSIKRLKVVIPPMKKQIEVCRVNQQIIESRGYLDTISETLRESMTGLFNNMVVEQ